MDIDWNVVRGVFNGFWVWWSYLQIERRNEMQIYRMALTLEQKEKLDKEYKKLLQTKTVKKWGKQKD